MRIDKELGRPEMELIGGTLYVHTNMLEWSADYEENEIGEINVMTLAILNVLETEYLNIGVAWIL